MLASVNSARESARMAAGHAFASQLHRVYGAEAVAIFHFEEGSGTTVFNTGDTGNTATIYGTVPYTTETPHRTGGHSLLFPGSNDDYVRTDAHVSIGNTWTLSAWVKPTGGSGIFLSFTLPYLQITASGFRLAWSGGSLSESNPRSVDRWYHVAATHADNETVLYVDGREVARNSVTGASSTNNYLFIGRHQNTSGTPFAGYVDDVRIFRQSLLSQEVRELYAQSMHRYQF